MTKAEAQSQTPARIAFVASAIALMAASFVLIKTARDALYFHGDGLFDLPKAYIGIALLSVPFAFGTLRLMRGLGPRGARVVLPLGMAFCFALLSSIATEGGGLLMTAVFMLIPLAFGVMFSMAWLLAADLLDGLPNEKLAPAYGRIGAGSIIGGASGALVAKVLSSRVAPQTLMLVGALLLGAAAAVVMLAHRRYPPHALSSAPRRVGERGAGSGLFSHRYALVLLLVAISASLTGIFVEFQFYVAAATSDNDPQQNAAFFANFYLLLNAAALLAQLYLMPRVQRLLGVHGSLLIMPIAILGGAALLMTNGSLMARSGLKLTEGGLKASLHRSNWEQAFLPVDPLQRTAAKLWIDGAAARVSEGVAALALYLWLATAVADQSLKDASYQWITYSILATATVWLLLTRVLARSAGDGARPATDAMRVDLPLPDT